MEKINNFEKQDTPDGDLKKIDDIEKLNLPDFESTITSGLAEVRAMQEQVEILLTEIQTIFAKRDYAHDDLAGLLSRAHMLTQFSLPDTIKSFKDKELALAGPGFSKGQKALLFILGILRGGSALDLFTKSIKTEATRTNVLRVVEELEQSAQKTANHLKVLIHQYREADKRTPEQKEKDRIVEITKRKQELYGIVTAIEKELERVESLREQKNLSSMGDGNTPDIIRNALKKQSIPTPGRGESYIVDIEGLLSQSKKEIEHIERELAKLNKSNNE